MLLKAIEEKRFLPVGSDLEVSSSFQLIAGTNRDLRDEVIAGRFREDLFARINLWTYRLPGLSERVEDIEPNLVYLLTLAAQETGQTVYFNKEAGQRFLDFAQSTQALWHGNFRDLTASVTRMGTLADSGRITVELVDAEIERLLWMWQKYTPESAITKLSECAANALLGQERWEALDLFDQIQLQAVVDVCKKSKSMSDAGRHLFNVSRQQRAVVNDSDRLRKYLQKFGLSWDDLHM